MLLLRTARRPIAVAMAMVVLAGCATSPTSSPQEGPYVTIKTIEVHRFSVVSTRPFDDIVGSIDRAIGKPAMGPFIRELESQPTLAGMEAVVKRSTGRTDLMQFMRLDTGKVISMDNPAGSIRSIRLLIGNPITMRKMAIHVSDASAYAPITVLVDQRADGVHLSYDTIASALAPYRNAAADEVARSLDANVEEILKEAAGL